MSILVFAAACLLALQSTQDGGSAMAASTSFFDRRIIRSFGTNNLKQNRNTFGLEPKILVSHAPPKRIHYDGEKPLVLPCFANAHPAPTIHWLKNSLPISEWDYEVKKSYMEIGNLTTWLVINRQSLQASRDIYTCVIQSGAKTEMISSEVITSAAEGDRVDEIDSDYMDKVSEVMPLMAPKIVYVYESVLQIEGNQVVLPCKAIGNPTPKTYWLDVENNIVNDARHKVLPTGELVIPSPISPIDISEYHCVAKNSLGWDRQSTFLLVLKRDPEN